MPVTWVDGATPVNAANLEQLDTDIAAANAALTAHAAAADPHPGYQKESEEGQPNGYASLDAAGLVPLVQLPPISGGGVDFIGAWAAPTAYKKGDVVRYLGNDYMAVNDSTGVVPPAAAVIPTGGASVVTALPAAPFDTQEVILVDSLTVPTYAWRFKYVASITDANKWVFIGGHPAFNEVLTGQATALAATWQDLATVGPSFTVPRAGIYDLSFEADATLNAAPGGIALKFGAAATSLNDGVSGVVASAGDGVTPGGLIRRTLAAADLVKMQYLGQAPAANTYARRRLFVQPVRLA